MLLFGPIMRVFLDVFGRVWFCLTLPIILLGLTMVAAKEGIGALWVIMSNPLNVLLALFAVFPGFFALYRSKSYPEATPQEREKLNPSLIKGVQRIMGEVQRDGLLLIVRRGFKEPLS